MKGQNYYAKMAIINDALVLENLCLLVADIKVIGSMASGEKR